MPIKCDVSKEDQILAMFAKIKDEFGGVDVCISNAGVAIDAPLLTGKTEDWREMLEVNNRRVLVQTQNLFKVFIFLTDIVTVQLI